MMIDADLKRLGRSYEKIGSFRPASIRKRAAELTFNEASGNKK